MADEFVTLEHALKRGDIVRLREFLSSGGDPNLASPTGTSLLMVAAARGQGLCVELLLLHGAEPNSISQSGHHALFHAAVPGCHAKVVRLLLEHGADPDLPAVGQPLATWLSCYGDPGARVLEAIEAFREGAVQHL